MKSRLWKITENADAAGCTGSRCRAAGLLAPRGRRPRTSRASVPDPRCRHGKMRATRRDVRLERRQRSGAGLAIAAADGAPIGRRCTRTKHNRQAGAARVTQHQRQHGRVDVAREVQNAAPSPLWMSAASILRRWSSPRRSFICGRNSACRRREEKIIVTGQFVRTGSTRLRACSAPRSRSSRRCERGAAGRAASRRPRSAHLPDRAPQDRAPSGTARRVGT